MDESQVRSNIMIQKQSWVSISDGTNVLWAQIFHLYRGFYRRRTTIGFFIKGSARLVVPPRIEYKGFKFKYYRKGDIIRMLFVRQTYRTYRIDGAGLVTCTNAALVLKKRYEAQSKYLYGPAIRQLNRKRFLLLFNNIL